MPLSALERLIKPMSEDERRCTFDYSALVAKIRSGRMLMASWV